MPSCSRKQHLDAEIHQVKISSNQDTAEKLGIFSRGPGGEVSPYTIHASALLAWMTLNFLPAEPTDLCQGPIVISNKPSSHILTA